jgi:hypothetical protein
MGLSFCWGAFGIKGMVREKIVSTTFGGAAGHGERAPGTGAAHARIAGASVGRPLRGADREPHDAFHCYYNIITYNKNNIIYTTTDNIFSIHTINYK